SVRSHAYDEPKKHVAAWVWVSTAALFAIEYEHGCGLGRIGRLVHCSSPVENVSWRSATLHHGVAVSAVSSAANCAMPLPPEPTRLMWTSATQRGSAIGEPTPVHIVPSGEVSKLTIPAASRIRHHFIAVAEYVAVTIVVGPPSSIFTVSVPAASSIAMKCVKSGPRNSPVSPGMAVG